MLAQEHRFHGRKAITSVYRRGKAYRSGPVSIRVNSGATQFRAAVVVSKKVHKSAVIRNRIRRRIYEIFRLHVHPSAQMEVLCTVYDVTLAYAPSEKLTATIVKLLRDAKVPLTLLKQSVKHGIVDGKDGA